MRGIEEERVEGDERSEETGEMLETEGEGERDGEREEVVEEDGEIVDCIVDEDNGVC